MAANITHSWLHDFNQRYQSAPYNLLRGETSSQVDFFKASINGQLSSCLNSHVSDNPALDEWVANNQPTLVALVKDVRWHIGTVLLHALPAHDGRQIELKDAVEGLRYLYLERPVGYKATFVIPMMAHDIGRLLEGFFYHPDNPHKNWIPHAQLSFRLLKQILDKPDYEGMPSELKSHFLYAVLAHSGDNAQTYMARAVQTCDRMQLIGAEGFYRAIGYGVGLCGGQIIYPKEKSYQTELPSFYEHTSVLSMMEYIARNMRENIGGSTHQAWQKNLQIEHVALLMRGCGDDDNHLCQTIFAPECGPECGIVGDFKPSKKKIPDDIMHAAYELYAATLREPSGYTNGYNLTNRLYHGLESLTGSARLTREMQTRVVAAVMTMPELQRDALSSMLNMAETMRLRNDIEDVRVIDALLADPKTPEFAKEIARGCIPYLNHVQYSPAIIIDPTLVPRR